MEMITLKTSIDYLIRCTDALSLSSNTFARYKKHYEDVLSYCYENNLATFTKDDAKEFCERWGKSEKQYAKIETRKIAYTVAYYFETGSFIWKPVTVTNYPIGLTFLKIEEGFRKELATTLSPGTVRTGIVITRQFLYFLEQSGKTEGNSITNEDVLEFIKREAPNHKQSLPKLLRTMRKFVCYLRSEGITNISADRFLDNAGRCRQKVLPCFTEEELRSIFSKIDRTTDKGRRDYAVFLLALRTGLRAGDISKIKLTDIDWKQSTISIVQEKTHSALKLPLPVDVGNAIADYILHSRYKTNNPYVFLRIRNTLCTEPINPTAFNNCLRTYMEDAGINRKGWDGKSFHAFRRTAGTRMVEAKVPVTTVAQILGHGNMESSKRYIALDAMHLTECGLDLGFMCSGKEGLL